MQETVTLLNQLWYVKSLIVCGTQAHIVDNFVFTYGELESVRHRIAERVCTRHQPDDTVAVRHAKTHQSRTRFERRVGTHRPQLVLHARSLVDDGTKLAQMFANHIRRRIA